MTSKNVRNYSDRKKNTYLNNIVKAMAKKFKIYHLAQ